ncbi:MAG: hypothetical protein R2789_08420 [Microthrixaceae bacterium]
MDALFRELGIYASQGQLYEPVDHELLLSYKESSDGQILEEGITEGRRSRLVDRSCHLACPPRGSDGAVLHLLLDVRIPACG